jgi:hypothetical protein
MTANGVSRRELLSLLVALGIPADEAFAQDVAKVNPRAYSVLLENERVRVVSYVSKPGLGACGQGMHSHPMHLTVQLTPAKVRVTLPDGKVMAIDGKAGDVFFSPAETHKVENIGGSDVRAYIVELKDKDWKPSTWSDKI